MRLRRRQALYGRVGLLGSGERSGPLCLAGTSIEQHATWAEQHEIFSLTLIVQVRLSIDLIDIIILIYLILILD